jgi:anaerobic selenocysteine-containing dehydrogenase
MQMYHSWHSQNAWLRQILGQNRLFMNRVTARGLGLADDDWVWVSSHAGRIEAQLKVMVGVNPDTVWTWNAIGKRSGAWNLAADSPESARGFLLNHLITEMLPEPKDHADGDGGVNADPITGQAAWYDLRVRVEKVLPAEAGHSAPSFAALVRLPSLKPPPEIVRYGAPGVSGAEPREGAQ